MWTGRKEIIVQNLLREEIFSNLAQLGRCTKVDCDVVEPGAIHIPYCCQFIARQQNGRTNNFPKLQVKVGFVSCRCTVTDGGFKNVCKFFGQWPQLDSVGTEWNLRNEVSVIWKATMSLMGPRTLARTLRLTKPHLVSRKTGDSKQHCRQAL